MAPAVCTTLGRMDVDALCEAYWNHYRCFTSSDRDQRLREAESEWADEFVDEFIGRGGDQPTDDVPAPVELLVALAERAPDLGALAFLGAGPIEDLPRGGAVDIDDIETAATGSEAFRTALRCAWFDSFLPTADTARLRRFGEPL